MKITLTLTAGIELANIELKGLCESEIQKNWDWTNSNKQDHGRRRESHNALESLSGNAKGNFDMKVDFDLQPEEMKSCYSCIEQLVKTVADSHRQTAEVTEKVAKVVEKADLSSKKSFCFPENPIIEKLCRDFFDASGKAHQTENITDIEQALYIGDVAYNAFDDFGYLKTHKATLADIRGSINGLKELRTKKKEEEATAE